MEFCYLNEEGKTFDYLVRYGRCMEEGNGSFLQLDNEIQAYEIDLHLERNGYSSSDNIEKINWIRQHGKAFRKYLNTIKLIYVIWLASGHKWHDFTFDEYRRISSNINNMKEYCLDYIF